MRSARRRVSANPFNARISAPSISNFANTVFEAKPSSNGSSATVSTSFTWVVPISVRPSTSELPIVPSLTRNSAEPAVSDTAA
jgi:hypothetical protein